MRIYDENIMPALGPQKTIHQRNKSSPALSAMSQAGGLKVAAKRTAFGDLSNTANVLRPSKDDIAVVAKDDFRVKENLPPIQLKKQTTFQKPAQRPVSVTALKSLLSSVANNTSQTLVKQPLAEIQQQLAKPAIVQPQPTNTRKSTSKKSTTAPNDIVPMQSSQPQPSLIAAQKSLPLTGPVAPAHRELPPKPATDASNDASQQHELARPQSKYVDDTERREAEPLPSSVPTTSEAPSSTPDGIYIDDRGEVQLYRYAEPIDYHGESAELAETAATFPTTTHPASRVPLANHAPVVQTVNDYAEPIRKQKVAPVSEPEEYWDEEDAVENYEEGYVTARSFKSRGDNTTGGATTVLFPKETQKAKKELALAKELIEGSKTAEELDDETWDTTMVAEYGDEIFQYMKELEIKMLPNAHYMDNQAEIQWSMRAVLMDWIVQVHHRFNLLPETLFLCVNYIDRFLSCKIVSLGKLQLVGATAIFIAAKYEEIDCPSVQEIVYMVDGGYTVDEILKAERFMLTMLAFELGWPGPMSFLRRISKADDYDLETRTLAKYFLEITIMDERFISSPPSYVAAGAHCLARMMLRKGSWLPAHVYYSNYTYSQLYSLVLLMVECCEDARQHHCAVYDKYTDKRYKRASSFAEHEMRKGFQLLPITSSVSITSNAHNYERHAEV
ncbi:MAG: hypothetical protein Q9217_002890 [Psora testacea]